MLVTASAILLPFIGVSVSVIMALAIMDRHRRTLERGVCPTCDYDLAGLTGGVCPECGRRLYATRATGLGPISAEIGVMLLSVPLQAALLAGGFTLVADMHLGGAAAVAHSAVPTIAMVANAFLIAMAYSVRRAPKELSGVMLVYLVCAIDTGIAWIAAVAVL